MACGTGGTGRLANQRRRRDLSRQDIDILYSVMTQLGVTGSPIHD